MPAAARLATPPTARARPRLLALLIAGPLVCVIVLTALAYIGLTQQAQRDTLARASVAAQAARDTLRANMGDLTVNNGQLSSALPANVTMLNNDNAEAQQLRTQVGMDTLIAQREQSGYVVIASSLATAPGGKAPLGLGERLGGALASAACSSNAAPTTLSLAGGSYLAASAPLLDGSGQCVGAVIALSPQSALQSVPLEYTVILAMAGALLALLTGAVGLALHGRSSAREAARTTATMAALTQAQASCAMQMEQREWVARRLNTGRSQLQRMLAALGDDREALQQATSDVWAGVSHPGAPVDPTVAMRLARESAVVAARVGSRLNDVETVADALFADLDAADDVDAMLRDALAQADQAIAAMRAETAGARQGVRSDAKGLSVRKRGHGSQSSGTGGASRGGEPGDPFATNRIAAQRRFTGQQPIVAPDASLRQRGGPAGGQTGAHRAARGDSSQHRAINGGGRGFTGQTPAPGARADGLGASGIFGPLDATGQFGSPNFGAAASSGRHRAGNPPAGPRPPRQAPRPNAEPPHDGRDGRDGSNGRDRDSSGSRWLND